MLEQCMNQQKLLPLLIDIINNPLYLFKTIKKTYIENVEMEKPVKAEVIYEESSGDTDDQDEDLSAHT